MMKDRPSVIDDELLPYGVKDAVGKKVNMEVDQRIGTGD